MNNTPKISIIVPVYKAEKYLNRCVDSILAQTFTDWELLLIDDGSPDRSGEICDEYASKDNRIRVFHKENGGVSSARQAGLDIASGEYIIHADPDDWAEPKMLEDLYNKAIETNADMVYCDFYQDYKNGRSVYIDQRLDEPIRSQSMIIGLLEGNIHGSLWNKLIRRTKIISSHLSFPFNVIRWEDLWFNAMLLSVCGGLKIVHKNKAYYHYDQSVNSNSLVRVIRKEAVESQIKFCKHISYILSNQKQYQNGIYLCEARTKELMFFSRLYSPQEITETFRHINERYIKENHSFHIRHIEPFLLSLLLCGHTTLAMRCNSMLTNIILPLKNEIKSFLWKFQRLV